MAATKGLSNLVIIIDFLPNFIYGLLPSMFLKMLSFESKECTKELKLEYANFLSQTS